MLKMIAYSNPLSGILIDEMTRTFSSSSFIGKVIVVTR